MNKASGQQDRPERLARLIAFLEARFGVPPTPDQVDGLDHWRQRVLLVMLTCILGFGTVAFLVTIPILTVKGYAGLVVFDIIAYLVVLVVLFWRSLAYKYRAGTILLLAYGVGVEVLISMGLGSGGEYYLFTFACLASILLGLRAAWAALALNAITLVMVGWLSQTGHLDNVYIRSLSMGAAVVAGINFFFLNAMVAFTVGVLVKGLENVHWRERTAAAELDRDRQGLIRLNSDLEQEVEDRRRIEAALKESEVRYRSLFENSPVSLWEEDFSQVRIILDRLRAEGVSDLETYFRDHPEVVEQCWNSIVILDINKATVELLEADGKEKLLSILDKLLVPESQDNFISEMVTLARGETAFEGEIEIPTLKGRIKLLTVIIRLAPGHEEKWDRLYVTLLDITEKRKGEIERLHREKLQGVVETAGAASHDLNQPLQVIVGQLELLLLNTDDEMEYIRDRVETALKEIDRMIEITRKLSRVTSVESKEYVSMETILDIDRSSGG